MSFLNGWAQRGRRLAVASSPGCTRWSLAWGLGGGGGDGLHERAYLLIQGLFEEREAEGISHGRYRPEVGDYSGVGQRQLTHSLFEEHRCNGCLPRRVLIHI